VVFELEEHKNNICAFVSPTLPAAFFTDHLTFRTPFADNFNQPATTKSVFDCIRECTAKSQP
jgi:hypothetical protein